MKCLSGWWSFSYSGTVGVLYDVPYWTGGFLDGFVYLSGDRGIDFEDLRSHKILSLDKKRSKSFNYITHTVFTSL